MQKRKAFLTTMGVMASMFMVPEAFARINKKDKKPGPMLTNRSKENSYWYIGHLMSLLLTSKETNGQFALLRATERKGFEPPPHTHTRR